MCKYSILFAAIVSTVFALVYGSILSMNNTSLGVVTANWIDSGSLLASYHNMLTSGDFNQNHHYHASAYGWPYNSLVIAVLELTEFIKGRPTIVQEQAFTARLVSFLFSLLSLIAAGYLFSMHKFNKVLIILSLVTIATFSGFTKLSYTIKPEAFGLFCSFSSLIALSIYCKGSQHPSPLYLGWGFAILATLAKQPYLVYLIPPLVIGFHPMSRSPAKLRLSRAFGFILIAFVAVFISHPYAILDLTGFIEVQVLHQTAVFTGQRELMVVVGEWMHTIGYHAPWFGLAVILSAIFLVLPQRINFGSLFVSAALSNLLFLALLIAAMGFTAFYGYLYPIIPAAFFVILSASTYVTAQVLNYIIATVLLVSIVSGSHISVATVKADATFSEGPEMEIVNALRSGNHASHSIVFTISLPVSAADYREAYGHFTLSRGLELVDQLKRISPDIIVVDN